MSEERDLNEWMDEWIPRTLSKEDTLTYKQCEVYLGRDQPICPPRSCLKACLNSFSFSFNKFIEGMLGLFDKICYFVKSIENSQKLV